MKVARWVVTLLLVVVALIAVMAKDTASGVVVLMLALIAKP